MSNTVKRAVVLMTILQKIRSLGGLTEDQSRVLLSYQIKLDEMYETMDELSVSDDLESIMQESLGLEGSFDEVVEGLQKGYIII